MQSDQTERLRAATERNWVVGYCRRIAMAASQQPVMRAGKFKDLMNRLFDDVGTLMNQAEAEAYQLSEDEWYEGYKARYGSERSDRDDGGSAGCADASSYLLPPTGAVVKTYRVSWRTKSQEGETEVACEDLTGLPFTILAALFPPAECPMVITKIELIDPEQYLS